MTTENHEALWTSYNARGLSPELVAKSFVASKQFKDVALARNTVLLGPRGSGKTTLLRMLEPRALTNWEGGKARAFKQSINYLGAFIPIDAPWILSLRQPHLAPAGANTDDLAVAVYSLALGRALVDLMVWRTRLQATSHKLALEISPAAERALAGQIAELWLPNTKSRSLSELRGQLTREVALLPRRWIGGESTDRDNVRIAYSNPLELAVATCETFNEAAHEPDRVWALLCDELEIAPQSIQRILFNALRAPPRRLLLKLAFSPAVRTPLAVGIDRTASSHDFDVVPLSYPTRAEGPDRRAREEFCRAMWTNLVAEKALTPESTAKDPRLTLDSPKGTISAGSSNADRGRETFVALSKIDASFAHYLKDKKVSLDDFEANPKKTFDSVIRKIRPIVEWRLHYLRAGPDETTRRASKVADTLYCGAERIFALSEGHPRWLKSTLGSMLSSMDPQTHRVSTAIQTREISLAEARLESRIRAYPVEKGSVLSTYSLICRIGEFFEEQILGQEFHADPLLSLLVDDDCPEDALMCLETALNIGALIPMQSESGSVFYDGIKGHRLRLSNWLAPRFRLPLMTGKAAKLSRILERAKARPSVTADEVQPSLGLFT